MAAPRSTGNTRFYYERCKDCADVPGKIPAKVSTATKEVIEWRDCPSCQASGFTVVRFEKLVIHYEDDPKPEGR